MPLGAESSTFDMPLAKARSAIAPLYRLDEARALATLIEAARLSPKERGDVVRGASAILALLTRKESAEPRWPRQSPRASLSRISESAASASGTRR